MRYVVARVDEITSPGRKIVTVAGRSLGVFNVDGEFFAVRNRCPHEGGPLCLGQQLQAVESDAPGSYTMSGEPYIVRCPWHQWEFDLRTGASWYDPKGVRVRAYETTVRAGSALLEEGASGQGDEQPYRAEMYPVTIEGEYVVVDLGRTRAQTERSA